MASPLARYRQIADELTSAIKNGLLKPGETLPIEPDLAKQFAVSRMTLRKAVDQLVEEGLVKRQQGSGTFVTDNRHVAHPPYLLYLGQTKDHFFKDVYCALTREAQSHHLAVTAFDAHANLTPQASKHWLQLTTKALAVIHDEQLAHDLMLNIPKTTLVLDFGRQPLPGQISSSRTPDYHILLDTHAAVRIATEYLLKLGHRRIVFVTAGSISKPDTLLGKPYPTLPEYLGFQDALLHAGITEELVMGIAVPLWTQDWEKHYDAAIRQFLSQNPVMPTAFVCDADFRAVRLLSVMNERGLHAPEDFSVIGLWNTPWCNMTKPPLSSMSFSESEIARLLVMLSQQSLPADPVELSISPKLIQRGSCGPASPATHRVAGLR